jgi:hypothetical protein
MLRLDGVKETFNNMYLTVWILLQKFWSLIVHSHLKVRGVLYFDSSKECTLGRRVSVKYDTRIVQQ